MCIRDSNRFFPNEQYRKLAIHFTIDDIAFAEKSVDSRMSSEMRSGVEALKTGDLEQVVNVNAGGPYGSAVLKGVEAQSQAVWEQVNGQSDVADGWYKASFKITGHESQPWTVTPQPEGSQSFEFVEQ
eukprot:TRINITY_DN13269_c0_g1_i1.p1 TRINITY_DN13269_c0_g1~~TRINITY_DN13269_c0_g1_i1.p1  ORF type:complete len:144 (+),score=39.01 TRINITY_DN13269_c0_g1_i1:51-434(+)